MANYDDDDPWLRERWPPEERRPTKRSIPVLILIVALGVALGEGLVAGIRYVLPMIPDLLEAVDTGASVTAPRPPAPASAPVEPAVVPDTTITSGDSYDREAFRAQTRTNCELWRERAQREASPFNMRMRDQVCGVLELMD